MGLMNTEAKQTKRVLVFSFWFSFAGFAAIRMLALFRCAWQQHDAGLPVNPLGNSFGSLTPMFGFPLSIMQDKAGTGLSPLLNCGIVFNGLFLGLVAASFAVGWLVPLVKLSSRRAQP